MERLLSLEEIKQNSHCVNCKNPYLLKRMCECYHFICSECQTAFPNCPLCFGSYLSEEYLLQNSLISEMANAQGQQKNLKSLTSCIGKEAKKTPLEKLKENFFLQVWDALVGSLFSTSKNDKPWVKSTTKIASTVAKKMGKSMVDILSTPKNANSKASKDILFPLSIGLLVLLLGVQSALGKRSNK